MRKLSLLVLFLFVVRIAFCDEIDPTGGNYISIKNAYRFELPAFNLSIQLPKQTGFRVPYWTRDDIALNINDDHVNYCFDVSKMKGIPYSFQFSLSGRSREDMLFRIEYFRAGILEEMEKEKASFISELPSIKLQSGIFEGRLLQYNDLRRGRSYYLKSDNLLLTFVIFCEEKNEIRQCEKIIESIRYTDLKEKYTTYLERQANRHAEIENNTNPPVFTYIVDTLKAPTVLSFPSFGLQMAYPSGWSYGIMASENMILPKKDTVQIDSVTVRNFTTQYIMS